MINHELVYKITSFIPEGKVLTYAALAKIAGVKSPRVIGSLLHKNKDPRNIPCYRVVNTEGKIATNYTFGGARAQLKKLQTEEVKIIRGQVDLTKHLWRPSRVLSLYFELLRKYGEPGPWPWWGKDKPYTREEIAIGAILTQNTNWKNVEKAVENLKRGNFCSIDRIYDLGRLDLGKLRELIRSSGFYNQKAERLFKFCRFIVEGYGSLGKFFKLPTDEAREKLLAINGVGKETADTILLYAGNKPIFVIDSYTKKFVKDSKLWRKTDYDPLQKFFTENLPGETSLYQDYHALIVRWGKEN